MKQDLRNLFENQKENRKFILKSVSFFVVAVINTIKKIQFLKNKIQRNRIKLGKIGDGFDRRRGNL